MKKLVILAVALIAAFSLTACEVYFGDGGGAQAPITSLSPTSGDTAPPPTSGAEQPDTTPPPSETSEPPTSAAPSATEPKQGDPIFTSDKAKYTPEEAIILTVSGITQKMVDDGAWIGIYEKGAANEEYLDYVYVEGGSSVAEIIAPGENGNFELRLFKDGTYDAVLHTAAFTVG